MYKMISPKWGAISPLPFKNKVQVERKGGGGGTSWPFHLIPTHARTFI